MIELNRKKENDGKFIIELNGKREIVDPSKLSLNEHYKILLPIKK